MSMERLLQIGRRVAATSRMLFSRPFSSVLPAAFTEVTADPALRLVEICAGALPPQSSEEFTEPSTAAAPDPPRWAPVAPRSHDRAAFRQARDGAAFRRTTAGGEVFAASARAAPRTEAAKYGEGGGPRPVAGGETSRHRHFPDVTEGAESVPTGTSVPAAQSPDRPGPAESLVRQYPQPARPQIANPVFGPQSRAPALLQDGLGQQVLTADPPQPLPARPTPRPADASPASPIPITRWTQDPADLTRVLAANLVDPDSVPVVSTTAARSRNPVETGAIAAFPTAITSTANAEQQAHSPQIVLDWLMEEFERRLQWEYRRTYGTSGGF